MGRFCNSYCLDSRGDHCSHTLSWHWWAAQTWPWSPAHRSAHLPCPRMCIPKVSGDEGKLCSWRYLIHRQEESWAEGESGKASWRRWLALIFIELRRDRCSGVEKLCELIERHVFLLCLILLREKHTSSLQNEVHFHRQPQILFKGIWGTPKSPGSVWAALLHLMWGGGMRIKRQVYVQLSQVWKKPSFQVVIFGGFVQSPLSFWK